MNCIQISEFGGHGVVKVASVPRPTPQSGEVLVAVKACGVNPVDLLTTSGAFPFRPIPFTPGFDGAGIIAEVGPGVTKWKVGDRVWFFENVTGSFAEYTVCKEKSVSSLPEKVSFEEGAAIGIPYNTAYRALFHRIGVKPGQSILVHGASGGTGIACVQMAHRAGCTVYGTASGQESTELLKKMHVKQIFNHKKEGYENEIKEATGNEGVDAIIEFMANANLNNDLTLIKKRGKIAVIGSKGSTDLNSFSLLLTEAVVTGVLVFDATEEQQKEAYDSIFTGLKDGSIKPVVNRTFRLEDAASAYKELEGYSVRKGKLVLLP